MLMGPYCTGGDATTVCHVCLCEDVISVCVCVYLSRSDGPSMQQGQQTAEGGGAGSSGSAACVPHQVGKQDVAQEPLCLFTEMPKNMETEEEPQTEQRFYQSFSHACLQAVEEMHEARSSTSHVLHQLW